jgi:hypothetical protein
MVWKLTVYSTRLKDIARILDKIGNPFERDLLISVATFHVNASYV